MPTTTFSKEFKVTKEKQEDFVRTMLEEVEPTLPKDFQTKLVFLSQDKSLKSNMNKALSK